MNFFVENFRLQPGTSTTNNQNSSSKMYPFMEYNDDVDDAKNGDDDVMMWKKKKKIKNNTAHSSLVCKYLKIIRDISFFIAYRKWDYKTRYILYIYMTCYLF